MNEGKPVGMISLHSRPRPGMKGCRVAGDQRLRWRSAERDAVENDRMVALRS